MRIEPIGKCVLTGKKKVIKILKQALISIIITILISACAGPSMEVSVEHPMRPSPLLVADASSDGISDEEAALLDPDYDTNFEEDDNLYLVADPLEGFNRAMFHVNDKLYFWVLKPIALGYRAVVPQPARLGVNNFFHNIAAPIRIINSILQGKGRKAEAEVARFVYNTTVGVLGFGNPANKYPELNPDPEDFGQTLGRYGIGDGFFVFLPAIGPTTLRDALGLVGDGFLTPRYHYVEPFEVSLSLTSFVIVNSISLRIGDYESVKDAALDPYQAFRNGYIQLRQSRIKK